MEDERIPSARKHIWISTLAGFVLFSFAGERLSNDWLLSVFLAALSVMFMVLTVVGPAVIAASVLLPTIRLRLFWCGVLLPVALVTAYHAVPDQNSAQAGGDTLRGWMISYLVGWSLLLEMPEFTFLGKYFPSLRFVERSPV